MENFVFFLGGGDAEMLEIGRVLKENKCRFHDKRLAWGACMSDYTEEIDNLEEGDIPVFVELAVDLKLPQNALLIDHHNERAGRDQKTSIEQVADLLKIRLDSFQRLIAANDRGHVRAMKKAGATEEQIRRIRAMDRKAQGVTERDEALAAESVEKRMETLAEDCVVVFSLTPRLSAVLDRIGESFRGVVIFSPNREMLYTGPGDTVFKLKKRYEKLKAGNPKVRFWYGGELPEHGFFGTDCPMDKREIKELLC